MRILSVTQRCSLSVFLGAQGFPGYRSALLLRHCEVRLGRRGAEIVRLREPEDLTRRLTAGDQIYLPDTLPPEYERALTSIPEIDYRDYAFVPGDTPYDDSMRRLFAARTQTILLRPSYPTVSAFLGMFRTNEQIVAPVRDILMSSHANPEGRLRMAIETTAIRDISYEDLEELCRSRQAYVPEEALFPRPAAVSGPRNLIVHVRGCRIGRSTPFLDKLRQALNVPQLTACKHVHAYVTMNRPRGEGEYMEYSFEVNTRAPLSDITALIAEFVRRGYTTVDGAVITADIWRRWLSGLRVNSAQPGRTQRVTNPITGGTEPVPAEFRHRQRHLMEGGGSISLPSQPQSQTAMKQELRRVLEQGHARYRQSHPWPEWARYGYASMDEFIDGWEWNFNWNEREGLLEFNPTRYEYALLQPVVTPSNSLYMNFYYADNRAPLVQIPETDLRFFGVSRA